MSALLRGAEKTGREQPIIPPTRYLTLDKRSVMAASNFRGKLDSCVDVSLLLPHFGFGGKMDDGDDRPLSVADVEVLPKLHHIRPVSCLTSALAHR